MPQANFEIMPILDAIWSSGETTFFVVAIFIATVYFGHFRFSRFSLAHGPEILTTLGIMGCFLGIALALVKFEPSNIQASVPLLLQGVKTAFWSSLAGVTGALYLRFLHHVRKPPAYANADKVQGASLNDVVTSVQALRTGLVGEEQGTLLSHTKLQRQESKDKFDELIGEFRNFSTHMVENNQKAIIDALRQVIADFNNRITEQFGENFKQLNLAVGNLLVWQEQYKQELDVIKQAQLDVARDFSICASRFAELVQNATHFAQISESLRSQLNLAQQHQETLFVQERALADVLVEMKTVTPTFATSIDAMLKTIEQGARQVEVEVADLVKETGGQFESANAAMTKLINDVVTSMQRDLKSAINTSQAAAQQVATDVGNTITLISSQLQATNADMRTELLGAVTATQNAVRELTTEMDKVIKQSGTQLQAANAEMKSLLSDTMRDAQKQVSDDLKANVAVVKEGVLALDRALQTELNNSLEGLGRQLASLSNRFVEDYTPLTERLREVVSIARSIER